ncbi:MAG: YbgF trimerization domain-containing protein [Thiolinea sp.]
MSTRLNRGLLLAAISITAAGLPAAHAVSDDVAVQMLERLNELEQEVSNLRGENEMLRNQMQNLQSTQRQGFLEVDERMNDLEQSPSDDAAAVSALPPAVTVDMSDTADSPLGMDSADVLNDPGPGAADELPSLEDPVSQGELLPEPATPIPALDIQLNDNDTEDSDPNVAYSDPEDRKALAPLDGSAPSAASADPVDPMTPESYYYYGTDTHRAPGSTTTSADTNRASLVREKTVATDPGIPAEHQAKAEYNEAYKLLVNDPKLAVPAFALSWTNTRIMNWWPMPSTGWVRRCMPRKILPVPAKNSSRYSSNTRTVPRHRVPHWKLGYSFYELGQWDFARRTLEDTIRFFPDSDAAKLAEGCVQHMTAEGH